MASRTASRGYINVASGVAEAFSALTLIRDKPAGTAVPAGERQAAGGKGVSLKGVLMLQRCFPIASDMSSLFFLGLALSPKVTFSCPYLSSSKKKVCLRVQLVQ